MPPHETAPTKPTSALAGVRVLDISNFLAAPLCSMFLADFGADVIKIERPDNGDELRYWGNNRDGVGLYYKVVNRGKRSVTADLRTPLGVEIVKKLVVDSDVLVENYRTGKIESWGIGPDVLLALNPALVIVRVTGFGQTGPYRKRPGFGTLAEAFTGYAHISGNSDGPPTLPGFGLADATTGLMAAYLASVALHEAKRSGKGQVVDLAIYETLFTLLGPQVVDFDQLGLIQQRNGSRLPFTAPRNTYRTRDGKWVSMAGSAQSAFERICAALNVPELIKNPLFASNRVRLTNATALDIELQRAVEQFDLTDILARFDAHDAPIAPVNDVSQIINDPQVKARENVISLPDEELGGMLRMQNIVGRFSRTPGEIRATGPRLGQHNQEILVDRLGIDPARLKAAGIVLGPQPEPELMAVNE